MNVWHKVKNCIIAAGWIIASVFGISLLCRKRGKSNDTGTVNHEREIRDGINRQGQSIDNSIKRIDDSIQRIEDIKKRIDGIENVVGNNEERESATQELVDESRKLRERAKKLIEKQGN